MADSLSKQAGLVGGMDGCFFFVSCGWLSLTLGLGGVAGLAILPNRKTEKTVNRDNRRVKRETGHRAK